jgi:hypothetical protein
MPMMISAETVRTTMQAKQAMGAHRPSDRRPVAIAMSLQDQVNIKKGGAPPPREPDSKKAIINFALGNITLLAAALIWGIGGTPAGLLLVPFGLTLLYRAFTRPQN